MKFYREFDAIQFKYGLDIDAVGYGEKYAKIENLESAFQFAELTKVEYGDVLSNLDLIYARKEKSNDIVELFDLIRNKIIHQYINIDGLERLFSEKYIDFEWDMHLGIDYQSHEMRYYRDHFIHQIRNAYCMHKMLEELQWYKHIEKILMDPGKSKISEYVCKNITQQKIYGYYNGDECVREYDTEEFYCKNIIYMASYMAALFHDIGYPEVTNALNQKRIVEYISNLYNAEASGYNYSRLNALLQNSLLFRVVPFREIKMRISKEKTDHGALSAIIFLLNFYENGAIHGLPPYKKCAVEIAALAIYNHTNKYRYDKKVKEGEYVKNIFALNPISYLLRICDDMQEWGRIYFELSNRSNLIICNTCKTPIVRKRDTDGNYFYRCNCGCKEDSSETKDHGIFEPMFDYDSNFPYRRIYNVTVCEDLNIEGENDVLCFGIDYKLERLLHIAYINPSYAKHRVEELNGLKKMLDYQSDLPQMKLKYFMTANPILIKVRILEEFLENNLQPDIDLLFEKMQEAEKASKGEQVLKRKDWKKIFEEIISKWEKMLGEIIEEVYPVAKDEKMSSKYAKQTNIREKVKKAVDLYVRLLIFMRLNKMYNDEQGGARTVLEDEQKETLSFAKDKHDDLYGLIWDCLNQFNKMYQDVRRLKTNPENYYKQFESGNYIYGCINRFLSLGKIHSC